MQGQLAPIRDDYGLKAENLWDFQRAMLNILEDSETEKKRLELMQTAMLNILEDVAEEKARSAHLQIALLNLLEDSQTEKNNLQLAQTATLNILEDFGEEKYRFAQLQTAILNILEDSETEKTKLQLSQTATLNILEDFSEEKHRYSQIQTAVINILEDSEIEKNHLRRSQKAFLNILEDIDQERAKVATAYKQIEATNKDLTEFAYAASHDLRAPLRVIDNASKWLEEDLQEHLTEETRENMNLLRGRISRMEKLLDDLLTYSRIGRKMDQRYSELISGDALIDNILGLLSPPKAFNIKVTPNFSHIQVYRMPLQQILMNLICNAIKHHDKETGNIEITAEDRGGNYVFAVKDDGPGIPEQFHDLVFKMFQTLKPRDQVEGSGMGLAMVRKNIEVFGGSIQLESSEGNGSTFRFTWPRNQRLLVQT